MKKILIIILTFSQGLSFCITPKTIESNDLLLASWLRKIEDRIETVQDIDDHADSYQTVLESDSNKIIISVIKKILL